MFEVKKDDGIIEVHYAPIAVDIENNQFVEDYLQSTFKEHKDFIKDGLPAIATRTIDLCDADTCRQKRNRQEYIRRDGGGDL